MQKSDGPTNNTAINVATSPSGDEIRSVNGAPNLPNNSLYNINPDSQNDYLIESDPAFTGYRNWLTSDYMLDRLKLDPNITQKRLGDGYYEQQHIRDQIMMLTGRYYLQDYSTQDAQFKGLMDAGVTNAQILNLRPGIALTASQVANLTSDIIWMEQQQVTLADGSTQSVLVPKVYVRANQGAIRGDGSFIAAERVNLSLTGNLDNQGLISAQKTLNINADNINNTNGGRLRAADARLTAENKITNVGGSIFADNTLGLKAKSVENISTTFTTNNQLGASSATRTGIDQVASIGVGDGLRGQVDANGKALTTLAINATNDVTFNAGILNNQGGNTQIVSKEGNVAFNVINTGNEIRAIGDANNYYIDGQSQDIGSRVSSYGDLDIAAKNVSGTAATLTSDSGNTSIYAKNDVTFKEGRATSEFSTANKMTSRGFLSKKTTQERFETQSDSAITSNIEGNQVAIQAGNNISLTGTNAISDKGTSLTAGGDIDILAAQNTSSENTYSQTKKSGLFGASGGLGFTIGKQQTDDSNAKTALTHTASKVGAIDGNVIIDAGRNYQQTGSNIVAGMGADSNKDITDPDRGNTVIRAQNIDIDNVMDVYTNQSEQKFKQSGLTVSVSNSLVDNAKSIDRLVDAGGDTDSMRMKGMAGVAAVLKTKALAKEATNAAKGMAGGINANSLKGASNTRIQATIGSQKSQSNSSSYTEKNQGSSINTNNLALSATGAGSDSNIDINGSYLTVSNDALFQADNDFNVSGVAQNSNTRNTNKSSSAAIGGYASTGSGVGITASASRGKGYANSDSVTYANSNIKVGNTTTLDIGNDVNIRGGVINTNKAQGQILGDVNIESLQDTATYDSKQKNMGFSADIDIAGGGAGSSLFVNGGKTNLNSDYKAVGEQSGIFTGDGGFNIAAGGKTTLIGGAITTTEAARDAGRNRYTSADGIKTQDINNTTSYDGDAIQAGLSLGDTTGKPQANLNGLGYGTDSDSDSSVTRAGITGIAGSQDITTDNRAEYAGTLENSFDAGRVNEELGAQTQITQEFGKEAPKAVAEFSGNIQTQLILDGDLEEAEKWAEGGAYRVALHTLVGAIATGSVDGALASGTTAISIPAVDAYLEKQGVDETTRDVLLLGLSATAGAVVGRDTASTATSFSQTQNNFLSHKDRKALNALLSKAKTNGRLSLSDSEKLVYLVQYDQVTNILLEEYRKNPSSLSSKDLKFLEVALNDLIKKGGYDAVAAKSLINGGSAAGYTTDNFLNKPKVAAQVSKERGNFLKDPWNYLTYTRNTGVDEDVYNKALTTVNINQQQRELSRYGGDAIYASPGGLGMALRGALAAKGMYDIGYGGAAIYDGKYKEGMVRVAGGTLEIVPAATYPIIKTTYANKSQAATIGTSIDSKVKIVDSLPLEPWVAKNFKDGKYQTVVTTESVITYRKFGGTNTQAKLQGAYASTKQNAGRNETAVYPAWSNSRFEATIEIPKNQQLSIGKVGQQPVSSATPKYKGGADQILLPRDYPSSWVKSIRDGKTGKVYTYKQFEKAFPDQIKR